MLGKDKPVYCLVNNVHDQTPVLKALLKGKFIILV